MIGMKSHMDHPSRLDWWGSAPRSPTRRPCGYEPGGATRSQEYGPAEGLRRNVGSTLQTRGEEPIWFRPRGHFRLGCAGAAGAGSGVINALASL